ncbi:MAG: SHOCT domain-containing protein [Chloroflexi bacterium]|nr:SHOCT domain-containing protein [Chloroflexota bacterium]
MMGGFGFGGTMLLGGLVMVAFWALVIGGAIWLVVTLARSGQSSTGGPASTGARPAGQTPLDILKLRYANGEITKEQFEEQKRDLSA